MDTRWTHPFTCVIAGPTGSGKTHFVKRFISHLNEMVYPIPQEVVFCYGEWQDGYNAIKNVTFVEGIPKIETWDTKIRRLVILDDLMHETDQRISKLFTKGSHHRNISVMFLVQNLFSKNKEQRTISLNSHYLLIFKNPRDASQISHLAKQIFPGKSNYVLESYKDATSVQYGYLLFDLRQETIDHLRLRTNLFPGEYQVAYLPK